MGIGRPAVFGGQIADQRQLLQTRAGQISVRQTDADPAFLQPLPGDRDDFFDHLGRSRVGAPPVVVRSAHLRDDVARPVRGEAAKGGAAGKGPGNRGPIIQHPRNTGLRLVPLGNRQHAHFQFQRGRHPVKGLHPVGGNRLAMRVDVDKAGRDDQPGGVDLARGGAKIGADAGDRIARDRDIADLIETRLGVDHAAVADQQIMGHGRSPAKGFSVLGQ